MSGHARVPARLQARAAAVACVLIVGAPAIGAPAVGALVVRAFSYCAPCVSGLGINALNSNTLNSNTLFAQQPTVSMVPGSFPVRGDTLSVLNGTLYVPANRTTGRGEPLALAFVRFPSSSAAPAAPIVFLAGGPGDAATRALQGMPRELLDALRSIADVIAFDQRGTGRSEPRTVLCPPGEMYSRAEPANPDARILVLEARVRRCLRDSSRATFDLGGLTTLESAHDLDALRRALDVPQLSLLAGSYGTHLALTFVREYPQAVQRMVLAGVEGPDHTLKVPSRVQQVLSIIAQERRPTMLGELDTLRTRLVGAPAHFAFPTGQTIVLGAWDLQRYVAESLDAVPEINAMVASIPAMIDGDYAPLARWALRDRAPRPLNLMNLSMDCASYASPARLQQIRAESEKAILGDAINFPLPALCERLALARLSANYRAPLHAAVPALLIAGEFDGRTPVENAYEVAANMPNARVMLVRGASHGLFGAAEVTAAMLSFFRR